MKVVISKNITDYYRGKCDGIQILNISEEDAAILEEMMTRYGKETKRINISSNSVENNNETNEDTSVSENINLEDVAKKVHKEKKIWIHKGNELKKINSLELDSYTALGYKVGKKDK